MLKVTGEYKDTIKYKNGKIETKEGHNIVVTSFLNLVTSLLAGKAGGIKYWAIGSGESSWSSSLPEATTSETRLTSEIGRKAINTSDMVFLDSSGEVSDSPTNKLKITVTFGYDECTGTWREFGLFGGSEASSTSNSGIMIDKKNHADITKSIDMEITRELTLTLNLA